MNERECLLEIARKREADAAKPGQYPCERERLLALARQHREAAETALGQAA